jgi:hypothetical protein
VSKILVCLAVSVGLVLVVAGCGGGGSSAWSDSDVAQVESRLAGRLTEEGLTPTKDETECMVEGLEPMASASEVLANAATDAQQKSEIEELTTDCLTDSSAPASESDPLEGLQACEEDANSSLCVEEAEERGLSRDYGEEEVGAEGYEEGNQGLNEMNEELQQEYEEEEITP